MEKLHEQLLDQGYVNYFNVILSLFFDDTMIKRGKRMYNEHAVDYKKVENGVHHLEVKSATSSKKYLVKVSEVGSVEPAFSCTCPYAKKYDSPCKHMAASLLDLGKRMDDLPHKYVNSCSHSTKTVFFFPIPEHLWQAELEFTSQYGGYYSNKSTELHFVKKSPEYIEVVMKESRRVGSSKTLAIRIQAHQGFLYTTCSCNRQSKGFCNHQTAVMQEIANEDDQFFTRKEWSDKEKKEVAIRLKFNSFEEASRYYDIKQSVEGVSIRPKIEGLSAPLLDEHEADSLVQYFTAHVQPTKKLPKPTKTVAAKKMVPAILIRPLEGLTTIDPIQCELDEAKTKVLSAIQMEEHFDSLSLEKAFYKNTTSYLDNDPYMYDLEPSDLLNKLWQMKDELQALSLFFHRMVSRKPKAADMVPVKISNQRVTVVLEEKRLKEYISLSFKVGIGQENYSLASKSFEVFPHFLLMNQEIFLYASQEVQRKMVHRDEVIPVKILNQYEDDFRQKILPQLLGKLSLVKPVQKTLAHQSLTITRSIYLSELDGFVLFKPIVKYGKDEYEVMGQSSILWNDYENGIQIERDEDLENEFVHLLRDTHPEFEKQQAGEFFYLSPSLMLEQGWFLQFAKAMKEADVAIYGQKELKNFKYSLSYPSVSFGVSSGIDWLDMNIDLSYDGQKVPLSKLRQALMKGQDYVSLADGTRGILPEEWAKKLERYFRMGHVEKDSLKVSKLKFNAIDDLLSETDDLALLEEIEQKKAALASFSSIQQSAVAKKLKATLRPYQIEGINWIAFLEKYNFGGILADDMGLGKTLQVIAHLALLKEKKKIGQNLVVAPRSLIYNWQNEVLKFYPGLSTLIHHGTDRPARIADFKGYDLIITTYGTLVNDVEWLCKKTFNWLVMDESQAIKNYLSKRNKALRLIKAKHRLALTGTPVENNSFDLYAQMQVLNPYLLGDPTHFKEHYAKPIDQLGDAAKSQELQLITQPFIIRRTKKQVAADLPEKTETVLTCEMLPAQRKLYDSLKRDIREELLNEIDEAGIENSQMTILAAMLKLRQLCLSTALPKLEGDYGNSSAKIDSLLQQLDEMPPGSKALVFSQFVQMLDLVKQAFDKKNIQYAYLDGRTRKREQQIDRFQTDPDCKAFLISLKAGGTGLNLTAADYVFILDPWWNPAVEAQAIDRAYRIGQEKQVFAYKMICKDSIEEKIIDLQQRKIKIAESVIKTDEKIAKSISKEDIELLFA